MIGKRVIVTNVSDGLGYPSNDKKYIGRAYNQIVKLVSIVPNTVDFYITDFYIPEYKDEVNDYIHYGFLKVSTGNITLLDKE